VNTTLCQSLSLLPVLRSQHNITALYTSLLAARVNGQICDGCRRRSVIRRPSRGHQKLCKIDPQLLWNTIRKLASLIPLPRSHPPADARLWRYSCFKYKYVQILIRLPVRLGVSCLTECDRRKLLLTFIVGCVDSNCGCYMLPKWNKKRTCSFFRYSCFNRVGQIKRGQYSFFRRSKACFREF